MKRRNFVRKTSGGLGACVLGSRIVGSVRGQGSSPVSVAAASSGSTGVLLDVVIGENLNKKHGLKIEPRRAGPSKVSKLVVNRGVDVGHASPFAASLAISQGRKIRLFGPWLANHTSLLVKPNSPYRSWKDLRGERVGVLPEPSASYYQTALRLAHANIDFEAAYGLQEAGAQAIHSSFQRGDLAGYVFFPPVMIRSLVADEAREVERLATVFEDIYGRNLHFQCLAAYEGWIDDNPDKARRMQAIIVEAAERISQRPMQYLREYTGTAGYETEEQFELAAKRTPMIYPTTWQTEDRNIVDRQIEDAMKMGIVQNDLPTNVATAL